MIDHHSFTDPDNEHRSTVAGTFTPVSYDSGILGSIMGGNYEGFRQKRKMIIEWCRRDEARSKMIPPHLRGATTMTAATTTTRRAYSVSI